MERFAVRNEYRIFSIARFDPCPCPWKHKVTNTSLGLPHGDGGGVTQLTHDAYTCV